MNEKIGTVTIAPPVLVTMARLAALSVPGVVRLSHHRPLSVERILRRTAVDAGVTISVEAGGAAAVDLYLVYDRSVNLLETSRRVQAEVARALEETVGMTVREINVHVDDVATDAGGLP